MKKLLIICGPTATGKSKLAFRLAKKFSGQIISADSRQVYKGMDIITGKDYPPQDIKLWGYDLNKPDEEFSVSHFVILARQQLQSIWRQKKLPIVVGGTGLYINSLLQPPATLIVHPNKNLRKKLERLTVAELQKLLKKINPARFKQMNHSDQYNPRRLIRAIEVVNLQGPTLKDLKTDTLWIGLTAPLQFLDQQIKKHVQIRTAAGAEQEIENLLRKGYTHDLPSMSALGYRQWPDVSGWTRAEQQYARRQLTWFKKNKQIHWFNITSPHWQSALVKLVNSWYT